MFVVPDMLAGEPHATVGSRQNRSERQHLAGSRCMANTP